LSRWNGNGWAQEVPGTFVKVLTDLEKGKKCEYKILYKHQTTFAGKAKSLSS